MTDIQPLTIETGPALVDLDVIRQRLLNDAKGYGGDVFEEVAVFLRDDNGAIIGGAYGELGWDWLYVDLLWVAESVKGRGDGRRVLGAIEQYALQQGVNRVHLATTSFQALGFYHHVGYRLFGVVEDRPPGYLFYFLRKSITPQVITPPLDVVTAPKTDDVRAISRGLSGHNRRQGVRGKGERLVVIVRQNNNTIIGGLIGVTYWGWLDLQHVWVDEAWRGRNYGARMLTMAEQEARRRGCTDVFTDVPEFCEVSFFEKRGYQTFTTLEDRPSGYRTHFMRKALLTRI